MIAEICQKVLIRSNFSDRLECAHVYVLSALIVLLRGIGSVSNQDETFSVARFNSVCVKVRGKRGLSSATCIRSGWTVGPPSNLRNDDVLESC